MSRRPTFRDPEGLYYIALVMMWNDQPARALDNLSRSVAAGFACPAALLSEPGWEPLRSSPEFAGLYEVVEERHREFEAAFAAGQGEELLAGF